MTMIAPLQNEPISDGDRSHDPRPATMIVPVLIVGFIVAGLVYLPWQAMIILGGSAVGAFIAWAATTRTRPIQNRNVISLYFVAVALQTAHMGEEYLEEFGPEFSELFGSETLWTETKFLMPFVFIGVPLWILAGVAMSYDIPVARDLGNYFAWFYAIGAGLVNAIAHVIVFPLKAGGYFPGLWTALTFHFVMSIVLIRALLRDSRPNRRSA